MDQHYLGSRWTRAPHDAACSFDDALGHRRRSYDDLTHASKSAHWARVQSAAAELHAAPSARTYVAVGCAGRSRLSASQFLRFSS